MGEALGVEAGASLGRVARGIGPMMGQWGSVVLKDWVDSPNMTQ
jgi:hypothetical protein